MDMGIVNAGAMPIYTDIPEPMKQLVEDVRFVIYYAIIIISIIIIIIIIVVVAITVTFASQL
jgi:hypothetical protein